MDKYKLQQELCDRHKDFTDFIGGLDEKDFTSTSAEKWTAGQQLKHILLSIQATHFVMTDSSYMEPTNPGKELMPYSALVNRYLAELKKGVKAPPRFIPEEVSIQQLETITSEVNETIKRICSRLAEFREEQLDSLSLPHPVFKNLTIREMMFFTIYHVEHHHRITKQNLTGKAQ